VHSSYELRSRPVRHERWLDDDEPYMRRVHGRNVQHDDQRRRLSGVDDVFRGYLRERARGKLKRSKLRALSSGHVHEQSKPKFLRTSRRVRRRYGADIPRNGNISSNVPVLPCRHLLSGRLDAEELVRCVELGS
jgi:hypothetical protein